MEVGLPDFREGQGKIGLKLENVQFPKALKKDVCFLSLNGKDTPILPFRSKIPPLT